jgi:hypothetical protein
MEDLTDSRSEEGGKEKRAVWTIQFRPLFALVSGGYLATKNFGGGPAAMAAAALR